MHLAAAWRAGVGKPEEKEPAVDLAQRFSDLYGDCSFERIAEEALRTPRYPPQAIFSAGLS